MAEIELNSSTFSIHKVHEWQDPTEEINCADLQKKLIAQQDYNIHKLKFPI
jgi:hypothetical protein